MFEDVKKVTHDITNSPLVGKQLVFASADQPAFSCTFCGSQSIQLNCTVKDNLCFQFNSKANIKSKKRIHKN